MTSSSQIPHGMENIQKESISGAHPLSHLDTSFFHSPHTLTQRNPGSHGNFYEGEQDQCRSIPVGALCGGLGISQWHKLCWSRAGVTLAGTTGQPKPGQEVFLVPPPTPTYLLRLHIYISAFVFHFVVVFLCVCVFQLQLPCSELLSLQWQVSSGVSQHHTFQPWCSSLCKWY